jgi:hypothetical protein
MVLRLFTTAQGKKLSIDGGSGPAPQPPDGLTRHELAPGLTARGISLFKEQIVDSFL